MEPLNEVSSRTGGSLICLTARTFLEEDRAIFPAKVTFPIGASKFMAARLRKALSLSAAKWRSRNFPITPLRAGPDRQDPLRSRLWKTSAGGGMSAYPQKRGRRILAALDELAARKNTGLAQIALAWLTATRADGSHRRATGLEQMKDLVSSTRQHLDAAEVEELDMSSAWM